MRVVRENLPYESYGSKVRMNKKPFGCHEYRSKVNPRDLISFEIIKGETNIRAAAEKDLRKEAFDIVCKYRKVLSDYIKNNPEFGRSFVPLPVEKEAPEIVRQMSAAAEIAGVGPMASVAGAIAEFTGKDLLKHSSQVIVENGGDIYLKIKTRRIMCVNTGSASWTDKLRLSIKPEQTPLGLCTSSGTLGHSYSEGKADAVAILADSAILADAVATKICNIVKSPKDVNSGIKTGKQIKGIKGILIVCGKKLGLWGEIQLEED